MSELLARLPTAAMWTLLALGLLLRPVAAQPDRASERRLQALIESHWQSTLRTQPELAPLLGDKGAKT
jgi:hypothetical protein